jgi:hypothetical protein
MKMARAFVASVPLAIVAVAALVVPLMVIPGSFGFQSWPKSFGGQVSEHRVEVAPAPRVVVVRKPQTHAGTKNAPTGHSSQPPRQQSAPHRTAPAPVGGSTPSTRAQTLHGHPSTAVVEAPSGSGPGGRPSSETPSPGTPPATPPAPAQPAPAPGTVPQPGSVASDEPPIARDDPADDPVAPPPAPVQEVVPQASPPAGPPQDDQEEHGHGHGNGHGLHLGWGHGRGHGADSH